MAKLWERIKGQVKKERETVKNNWENLKKDLKEVKRECKLERQQILEEGRKEKERLAEENRIFSEELDRKFEEQEERRRRFKAKDKTLVLTRSEYFWWKIVPILIKLIFIVITLFAMFIYGVWYFVIIPLFVGYVLLELFFWYMDR
jgi:ABC-type multidrug transport system fused ATPase/permease subunit|nr:MAG TPA_asm: vesicle-associated membrane protein 2 [Caudoviricetes sp.]